MAVYSGVAPPSNWPTIFDKTLSQASGSWAQQATPYYDNYFIFALSQMGHTPEAMKFVRWYWGGMMAEGATSMWEGYDPTWDKADFHLHLNADDGTGYFVSLAHGWSAGVTNWLTERVLGVRSTGAGFATCEIQPDLADLAWASGTIPTPHGAIKVRAEQQGPAVQVTIIIPRGVQAHVILPGTHIIVNGHRTANGLLQKPGKYIVRTE
jgi:hypothetical protein